MKKSKVEKIYQNVIDAHKKRFTLLKASYDKLRLENNELQLKNNELESEILKLKK